MDEKHLREINNRTRDYDKQTRAEKKAQIKAQKAESKKTEKDKPKEQPKKEDMSLEAIATRDEERKRNREQQAKLNWNVHRRNQLIHDLKHEQINEEGAPDADAVEIKQGKDLVAAAKMRAAGKDPKFRNDLPRTSWNAGFDKRMAPAGKRTREVIGADGRKTVVWENTPGETDNIVSDKELLMSRGKHHGRAMRGFPDKELAEKKIGEQVNDKLTDLKSYLEWMENGGEDKGGLKQTLAILEKELNKFGHIDLAERMKGIEDIDDVEEFVKTMNARMGIKARRKIPDLQASKLTFKDGHDEIVYHMPIPAPKKKLKIRPGFTAEIRNRPHGHEGRNDEVTQKIWTKDPDFTRSGIINQGDYKYDPDAEITDVTIPTHTTTNKFAMAQYSDGGKAFIKSSDEELLRKEYGVSRVYDRFFAGKTNVRVPRMNIIPANKMNPDLAKQLGGKMFARNEFVGGYPADLVEPEILAKIKIEDLADAWTISQIFGDDDFHMGNMMVDEEGNLAKIDNAHTFNYVADPEVDIYQPNVFSQALIDYYTMVTGNEDFDSEEYLEWFNENKEVFANAVTKFIGDNEEELIYEMMQNSLMDDSSYDEVKAIIEDNLAVLKLYLLGSEEEMDEKQEWWEEERQTRLESVSDKKELQEHGILAEEAEADLEDDKKRLAEIVGGARQANEMVERIRQKVMAEMEAKYTLQPKEQKPLKEHNQAEPKELDKPEYTMDDLFAANIQRRKNGLPALKSVEELIAENHPDEPIMDEIPEDVEVVEPKRLGRIDESEIPDIKPREKPREREEIAPIDHATASKKDILTYIKAKNKEKREQQLEEDRIAALNEVKVDEKDNLFIGNIHKLKTWNKDVLPNEPIFDFELKIDRESSNKMGDRVKAHLTSSFFSRDSEQWLERLTQLVLTSESPEKAMETLNKEAVAFVRSTPMRRLMEQLEDADFDENEEAMRAHTEWLNSEFDEVKKSLANYVAIKESYMLENREFYVGRKDTIVRKVTEKINEVIDKSYENHVNPFDEALNRLSDRQIMEIINSPGLSELRNYIDSDKMDRSFRLYKDRIMEEGFFEYNFDFRETLQMMSKHNSVVNSIIAQYMRRGLAIDENDKHTYLYTMIPGKIDLDMGVLKNSIEESIGSSTLDFRGSLTEGLPEVDEKKLPKMAIDIADTIRNGSIEHHYAFDDNEIFIRSLGVIDAVMSSGDMTEYGAYTIHNHPSTREEGSEGFTTFSTQDIMSACASGLKSVFVAGKGVIVQMDAPEGGWDQRFFYEKLGPSIEYAKSKIHDAIIDHSFNYGGMLNRSDITRINLMTQHLALGAACRSLGINYGVYRR